MADIGSTHARVLQDLHRSLEPEDQDQAMIHLIDAMEHYSVDRHWWNEESVTFDLTEGVQFYPIGGTAQLPADTVRPRTLQVNLTGNWSEPLPQVPIEDIRYWTHNDSVTTGYPTIWAWWDGGIWFYRIPNGVYQCRFDYIKDVNRPRYRNSGSAWVFEQNQFNSDTGQFEWVPLESTYTNEWLTHTARMIRTRAKMTLYEDFYDDEKNANRMARRLVADEATARKATQNFQNQVAIQPTPLSTAYFYGE